MAKHLGRLSSETFTINTNWQKIKDSAQRDFLDIKNLQASGGSIAYFTFNRSPYCLYFSRGDILYDNGLTTDRNFMSTKRGRINIEMKYIGRSFTQTLFCVGDAGLANYFAFYITNKRKLAAELRDASTGMKWVIEASTAVPTNKWVTVSIVQDGTTPWLEIDGVRLTSTFTTSADKTAWLYSLNQNFVTLARIGISTATTNGYHGYIRKMVIYDTHVEETKIAEYLFNEGHGAPQDNVNSFDTTLGGAGVTPQWRDMETGFRIDPVSGFTWEEKVPITDIFAKSNGHNVSILVAEGFEE